MWGNALGWTISAMLVLLTAGFLMLLNSRIEAVTPQTDFSRDGAAIALVALPFDPKAVLPMTDPTDAGPIYLRAINEYSKDPFTYGLFSRSGKARDIEDVPAIHILLEASHCATADIFASRPSSVVTLSNEKPMLEALVTLAICARHAGQLTEDEHPIDALRLYEAVFALGEKLYRERLTYAEFDAGLTMLAEGSTLIPRIDPSRAQACRQFNEARKVYVTQQVSPVAQVIESFDQPTLEQHAGDVFYLARHAPERMWRVEAIFALARYRFNAGRSADQRTAAKVLEELSHEKDPVIRAAAVAGMNLTLEQYRMLR